MAKEAGKVIKMAKRMCIKEMYEEGKSKNEISRRLGLNYRTVSKYAEMDDWNDDKLPSLAPENYPILGGFIPLIDEWLEIDKTAPRKQRHTAKRIYDRLRDEAAYTGSYSSVKRYVHRKRVSASQGKTGFLPIAHPMAHAQVDFGEVVYLDEYGKEHKAYELIVSFPYSNKAYVQVFLSQNQECLLIGMQRVFEYIGGVPPVIRFDNMSTAVVKVLDGGERELTDGFTRFKLHYRFKSEFCNPASGNEKGNVENMVGYIRRNAFVPIPTITDFDEFNQSLWKWCEKAAMEKHYIHGVTKESLWQEEKTKLLSLPSVRFNVFSYKSFRVSQTGFVSFETNKYGLSPELHNTTVQAKIFHDNIEFYHDKVLIAAYRRSYEKNKEFMDWRQYMKTLLRKPGAAEHTRFFTTMPVGWQKYISETSGKERRSALQLLCDIVRDGNSDSCDEILNLARQSGRSDVDSVKQCYYSLLKDRKRPEPLGSPGSLDSPGILGSPGLLESDNTSGMSAASAESGSSVSSGSSASHDSTEASAVLDLLSRVPKLNYNPDISVYDSLTLTAAAETTEAGTVTEGGELNG